MSRAGIEWEEATLRGKAMSLLMDWDASRPHTGVRPPCQRLYRIYSRLDCGLSHTQSARVLLDRRSIMRSWLRPVQAEFIPSGIVKLHGGLEETCWRYLMTWKRTAVGSAEASLCISMYIRVKILVR